MTPEQFLQKRKSLNDKLEAYKNDINKEYNFLFNEFLKHNSPVTLHKVYEMEKCEIKPLRGYSRFVVYDFQPVFFHEDILLEAWGWWLDKNDVPKTWKGYTVYGVGNPTVFRLSENQKHNKHPEAV